MYFCENRKFVIRKIFFRFIVIISIFMLSYIGVFDFMFMLISIIYCIERECFEFYFLIDDFYIRCGDDDGLCCKR